MSGQIKDLMYLGKNLTEIAKIFNVEKMQENLVSNTDDIGLITQILNSSVPLSS